MSNSSHSRPGEVHEQKYISEKIVISKEKQSPAQVARQLIQNQLRSDKSSQRRNGNIAGSQDQNSYEIINDVPKKPVNGLAPLSTKYASKNMH